MSRKPRRAGHEKLLTFVVVAVVAIALGVAAFSVRSAFRAQRASVAAADLQLASLQVNTAGSLDANGLLDQPVDLSDEIDVLQSDHSLALGSLAPDDRRRAEELLAEISGCGLVMMDPEAPQHQPHGHAELQNLLAGTAATQEAEARSAGRWAMGSSAVALALLSGGLWSLLRSRNRARREQTEADARADAAGRLQHELMRQASIDLLTGLPNRRALEPALRAADTRRAGSRCALLILDLDGFKNTNDTLGHLVGDQLLRDVSQRLAGTLHPGETLLRLGGDEFAAVLPDVPATPAVPAAAGRLLAALEAPFEVGPRSERLQASVGVATTDESCELEVLLRHADIALYEAKRVGGSAALAFEPEMEIRATASNVISRALAEADYDVEFHLAYQPVVEAHGGRTVSLEALLRWTSPSLGVVGPNEFIPVAEQTGDIREIGRWVIGAACAQLARWDAEGGAPDLAVSVNVSPRQLSDDYFVTETLAIAASQGIDPGRLIIEVTESAVLTAGGEAVEHLEELRSSGVRIAIDDFGTGFSNLGQLLLMPLDIIKVDRSLMLTLGSMQRRPELDSEAPCEVMSAIVSIANARGAPVICEGVETEEQAESLRSSGIQFLQGYLMGRPQPAEALTGLAGVRPRVGSGGPPEA